MRILCHPAEVFLECKTNLRVVSARCHDLRHGFRHCIDGPVVWAPGRKVRIESVTHHRHRVAVSRQYWQFRNHSLRLRHLVLSSMRHKYRRRPDRAVEHLHKAFLRAYVQVFQCIKPFFLHILYFFSSKDAVRTAWNIYGNAGLLVRPVGIQEGAGKIDDLFASPRQHKPWLLRYDRYFGSLQVLFLCVRHEFVHIFRINHYRHTLLGLGDGDFRSVQARVFLRNLVKVYSQAVSQFPDRHGHAARAEVVALLDQPAYFFPSEQTLDLTLCRRVALLYFRAASLNGLFRMYLGRSGRAAAAVTPCTAAQKDDDIARIRRLPDDRTPRRCSQNCSNLHPLSHIIRMIDLLYRSCGKTDLISIRTVSVCCLSYQLLLGQLALHCIIDGHGRICRACHAHCLIYIGTPGQRVTDRSAQAGCGTAERLDLRWMIVGLILKVHQPLFFHAVYLDRHDNTAGIDLVRLFLVV